MDGMIDMENAFSARIRREPDIFGSNFEPHLGRSGEGGGGGGLSTHNVMKIISKSVTHNLHVTFGCAS